MNRALIVILILSLTLSSCGFFKQGGSSNSRNNGEIVTEKSSDWTPKRPKGMVPIPSGSFILGQTDVDFVSENLAPPRTMSVSGFFMDDAETTNSQYRVFVNYVRDSIARTLLAERAAQMGYHSQEGRASGRRLGNSISDFAFISVVDEGDDTPYGEYLTRNATGRDGGFSDARKLNWSVPLTWDKNQYPDVEYAQVMEGLYYPPEERFAGERIIDTRKLKFKYTWVDQETAAKYQGSSAFRIDFRHEVDLSVYPDTTVWVRDFNYSHNDPLHQSYFWHNAYADYPVVGVTWEQATAYCAYRTKRQNDYLSGTSKRKTPAKVINYRLPTEIEWEYAARGGLQDAPYPWGGPYLMDDRGCYLANFKPRRGDYIETPGVGYMYTAPIKTFHANGYGLYDMAGNVAEWTASSYNNAFYQMSSTLNPSQGKQTDNLKSVRGGSWKDIGFLLMVSNRDYEHRDSARSYIGFRAVQSFPEGTKIKIRK